MRPVPRVRGARVVKSRFESNRSADDCQAPVVAPAEHDQDTLGVLIAVPPARVLAFFSLVAVDGECWIWSGAFSETGYPHFRNERGEIERGHRTAYRWFIGAIAPANQVHHLCNDKRCVNPAHLQQLTDAEHREQHARSTGRCRKGHLIEGQNVVHSVSEGRPIRKCAICHRARALNRNRIMRAGHAA